MGNRELVWLWVGPEGTRLGVASLLMRAGPGWGASWGWGDGGVGEQAESEGALPSAETRGADGPPAAHEQPLLLFSL